MSVLEQLYARRNELATTMRALVDKANAEDRDLDEAEAETFADAEAEVGKLTARIERLERVDALDASLDGARPAVARGQGAIPRAGGPEAAREFESLGEFVHAVRFRQNDQRLASLFNEGVGQTPDPRGEQRMDTGSSGGFMVPAQFRAELLRVDPAAAIVRPRARVIPAGSPPDAAITFPALDQTGAAPGHMYGGVEVAWISEGAQKPDTDADFREITLEPHEVAANLTVTDKLLRNWMAADALLSGLLRDAIVAAEDRAFIQGDGVGKPMGFVNSPARQLETRTGSGAIVFADIKNMYSRLLRRGAMPVWVAGNSVRGQLTSLRNKESTAGDDALVWQPSLREGEPDRLMGYPIVWSERSPTLGSPGDLALVDLSMYLVKDGSGPFIAASEHVLFKQNKTVIKAFWNVDGRPWLTAPFKGEDGFVQSPFVVLNTP